MSASTDIEIPEEFYPPEVSAGEHPAFQLEMLEYVESFRDEEDGGEEYSFGEKLVRLRARIDGQFSWMKERRAWHEEEWRYCEEEYELAESRRLDEYRDASVFSLDPDELEGGDETDGQRASVALPNGFENVNQMAPRYYDNMFGSDPEQYVEVIGRNSDDDSQAEDAQDYLNYEAGYLLNTPLEGYCWLRDAALYGSGIQVQYWDPLSNHCMAENVSMWDMWFDPSANSMSDCRYVNWRKTITLRDLMAGRDNEDYAFTNEALKSSAAGGELEDDGHSEFLHDNDFDPDSTVTLDIFMTPERWIYTVNEQLIIAIIENPLPPVTDDAGNVLRRDIPVHVFSPLPALRKKKSETGCQIYGLSTVTLSRTMSDLMNSMVYLMHKNLARNALGVFFVDDMSGMLDSNRSIEAGLAYPCKKPNENIMQAQFQDSTVPALNAIGHLDGRLERLTGVNDALRGQASYSTETATAKNQDLEQASKRVKIALQLGIGVMKSYWDVRLRYNQAYLEEAEFIRVIGEKKVYVTANNSTFSGVAGKDLIPTGMPLAGSSTMLAQQGLNMASVLGNMGVPMTKLNKLVRDSVRAAGFRGVDDFLPKQLGIGQDPRQENEAMLMGEPVEVGDADYHQGHFEEHSTLMYDDTAREVFKSNPDILMAWNVHISVHAQALELQAGQSGGQESQGVGGMPGINTAMPTARPKPKGELDAQMAKQAQ